MELASTTFDPKPPFYRQLRLTDWLYALLVLSAAVFTF